MPKPINILLMFGGGGNEHAISQTSQKYLAETLQKNPNYHLIIVEIKKNRDWVYFDVGTQDQVLKEKICFLQQQSLIVPELKLNQKIDYCIPCFHGYPGETGHIQGLLALSGIPFLGCDLTTSSNCMNKVTTKMWLELFGINIVPFEVINDLSPVNVEKSKAFFKQHKEIFVKASSEGSSVGVYQVTKEDSLEEMIKKAFQYSQYVLLEKRIAGRELEISTFEYQGKIQTTPPGEIVCPSGFYTYEEKYDAKSATITHVRAQNVSPGITEQMRKIAQNTFTALKIKDLARIDFFLTQDQTLYVNEVNTFPGMTPISLFPKMMIEAGIPFYDFLCERIDRACR
ncbi:MAG: D-alanine--D-alanine ligase [Bacteriovoracaceae bacterium]|nr:D-alanine--D-alanine ligase [Bacteriovoracaceae bacterium]